MRLDKTYLKLKNSFADLFLAKREKNRIEYVKLKVSGGKTNVSSHLQPESIFCRRAISYPRTEKSEEM